MEKIVLASILAFGIQLGAMEQPYNSLKRKTIEVSDQIKKARHLDSIRWITLISKEGDEFKLIEPVARLLGTIDNLLNDCDENNYEIPIKEVESEPLAKTIHCLTTIFARIEEQKNGNIQEQENLIQRLDGKLVTATVEKLLSPILENCSIELLQSLIKAANFLDAEWLIIAAAKYWVDQFLTGKNLKTLDITAITSYLQDAKIPLGPSNIITKQIAAQQKGIKELSIGDFITTTFKNEYKYIRNYDEKRFVLINTSLVDTSKDKKQFKALDFANCGISSLEGFANIIKNHEILTTDFLKNVIALYLDNNNLEVCTPEFLSLFPNLISLNLCNNSLQTVPHFACCPKLEKILIDNNKIERLPFDSFYGLSQLSNLSMQDNECKELPLGIFFNNSKLLSISVANNPFVETINRSIFESDYLGERTGHHPLIIVLHKHIGSNSLRRCNIVARQ